MFEFTTLTVYNSIVKATVAEVRNKSKKGYNMIVGGTDEKPELRIGNTRFTKDIVSRIEKKVWSEEALTSVTFDFSKLSTVLTAADLELPGFYRIAIYLGLSMNSQDSFYANDFVYKGKPLYIEFAVNNGEQPAAIASKVAKIAEKYMLFTAQEKILNVTVDGTSVTFEGVNGYQQIKKAVLQKYDPSAYQIDCCATEGDYVQLITGYPAPWSQTDHTIVVDKENIIKDGKKVAPANNEVAIKPGIEAFCDYNWIIHNLRLPTLANTYFWSPNKSEMPVIGANYNLYIVTICKERDGIAGEVVGQRAVSVTNHVFYVLDDGGTSITDFETELKKVLPEGKTDFNKDADTALKDPFAGLGE